MPFENGTFVGLPIPAPPQRRLDDIEDALNDLGGPIVNVQLYGAVGDGATDDSAAIQAAINSLSLTIGGTIYFPPATYNIASSVSIPAFTEGSQVDFQMTGAILQTSNAIAIFSRLPANQTQADTIIGAIIRFFGGTFKGTQTSGQIGLQLSCTYAGLLQGVYFQSLDKGLQASFCLDLRLENVRGVGNIGGDVFLQTGVGLWSGATGDTQSNASTLQNCRFYVANGAPASLQVLGSDGIAIRDCIFEGQNPTNNIYFDDQGSTTVQSITLDNIHVENQPSNAIIALDGHGHYILINNVFSQLDTILLDVSACSDQAFPVITNFRYTGAFTSTGAFKGNPAGSYWRFENWGNGAVSVRDPVWWVGGTAPTSLLHISRYVTGDRAIIETSSLFIGDYVSGPDSGGITLKADGHVGVATSNPLAMLSLGAGTTSAAQLNLPVSSAPSSPNDGDVWREDNTNTGLKIRVNGVTKTITLS